MLERRVTILGSTGSVGVSTLDLMQAAEGVGSARFQVQALAAGRNVKLLAEQARRWRPAVAVIGDESRLGELRSALLGTGIVAAAGDQAVIAAASEPVDWTMAAIVGTAGLRPAWAAAKLGGVLALANKESLVTCGPALLSRARDAGGTVIPVDSEHSAIFQVLQPPCASRLRRITLTASGGPFRTWTRAAMAGVTPEQAVAHPNWSMGAKISIDCATMANKGLEMIEASYLFDTPQDRIEVMVHPQSVIHSLVEYADGSSLAQLGPPDMRTPIACALAWPDRLPWPAPSLDLAEIGALTFERPDETRFPALRLARAALAAGGPACAIFNAANEIAVAAFLARRLGFLDIATVVEQTLEGLALQNMAAQGTGDPVESALAIDEVARCAARDSVARLARAA